MINFVCYLGLPDNCIIDFLKLTTYYNNNNEFRTSFD